MAVSSGIEQLAEIIKSLSDEDINRLAKLVRQERRRRGLKPGESREADQGEESDESIGS